MENLSVKCVSFFVVFSLISLSGYSQISNGETWTKEKAIHWMKSGVWENGLRVKAHPSVNPEEFAYQYHKNRALWDKAFAFLSRKDLDTLSPGTYPIDGENVFAIISEYVPKDFEQTKWESHRKYIDLHYVIRGKEKIGVAPVSQAKVTEVYNETKDIAHYETPGKYYIAEPGTFFLFFPQEAHRPGIKADGSSPVKKLVIKISVAE
jgi:YhcH/YjgK/YiaL family protein